MSGQGKRVSGTALKPLNPMDAYLIRLESPDTHVHTGSLITLRQPDGAAPDYVRELYAMMTSLPFDVTPPFFYRLDHGRRWRKPCWEIVDEFDVDYHLRYSILPAPGDRNELTTLIARLHSRPLDIKHPLWECHLIDGLADGRFAIFLKMHHALADGGTVVRLISSFLTEEPVPFTLELARERHARIFGQQEAESAPGPGKATALRQAAAVLNRQRKSHDPEVVVPYVAPSTPFGGLLGPDRTYAIQSVSLASLRELRKATGATINDLVLTACAAALRRYLADREALPDQPLVTSIAVALEREGESAAEGNEVAGLYMALPTHIADAAERLAFVRSSMEKAKDMLLTLPKASIQAYMSLTSLPFALSQMSGLENLSPPYSNVTISNVPGPREKLYFHGAEVEHMYPCSVIFNKHLLNITARGCGDHLNFGLVACPDAVPRLQSLADCIVEAVDELRRSLQL